MSWRMLSARAAPLARRAAQQPIRQITYWSSIPSSGGLLRRDLPFQQFKQRRWPLGAVALHNLPAVRHSSFSRAIPKLFGKFATLGAAGGGAVIAGLTYIQYQATAAGTAAVDFFHRTKDRGAAIAGDFYNGADSAVARMTRGLQRTKEDINAKLQDERGEFNGPDWLRTIIFGEESGSGGGGGSEGGPNGEPTQSRAGAVAAGAATTAAFGYDKSDEDEGSEEKIARDEQMMMLTKKMIQIRSLLQTVGQSEKLTLPSIVVIGSQSSGKSSVLESIVGHEFLPKGSNMVTRRPIELTLVNTPEAHAEYGEFPALGLGKVTDFSQIQKTLTDLNLTVPAEQCVSDDPIQLRIYSPNVPDLSLIDLPGYIQVTSRDQPPELKQKIVELCDKYIQPPNVILAISAADVDLANSTSLRASRRADPRGERTIGVITKMDLVEPQRGLELLTDKKYSLKMGYVGVVCRIPQQTSKLFNRGSGNISSAIIKNENAFFSAHPLEFGDESHVSVGTPNLKRKLTSVLERTMASTLKTTGEAIHQELTDTTYEFRVQYNERPITAETYLAESLDTFKHSFREFTDQFSRQNVRELLKHELDQQVLNLLAQIYWNTPLESLQPEDSDHNPLSTLPKADPQDPLWQHKANTSQQLLTKLGIGRLATTVVAHALQSHIDNLVTQSVFTKHPFARQAITDASAAILHDLSLDISDELEICIKPYKYRIELEDQEWARGRENVGKVLKEELRVCEEAMKKVENEVGGRKKTRELTAFIDRVRSGQVVLEGNGIGGAGGFSAVLLRKGKEAVFLRDRADILKMRLLAVKSKQCASKANKIHCPEVFLDAVADKLIMTADLFLDAELLSKFYLQFPRALDSCLGHGALSTAEIERFAREDPKVRRHIDVVRRKELLEHALKEMEALRQLEARERRYSSRSMQTDREKKRGWGLF